MVSMLTDNRKQKISENNEDDKLDGKRLSILLPSLLSSSFDFMVGFHALFFIIVAITVYPCFNHHAKDNPSSNQQQPAYFHQMGHTITTLVLVWNICFPILATYFGHTHPLFSYWKFACIVSIFQVIPDWFLVVITKTLHFPDDGAYKIGNAVSCYMAGMWSIPFVLILYFACFDLKPVGYSNVQKQQQEKQQQQQQQPSFRNYVRASIASLIIIGGSEQILFPLNLWTKTVVVKHTIGCVALYVLPAEFILGPTLLYAYSITTTKHASTHWLLAITTQVIGAFMTMLVYIGALAVTFLFIENVV